MRTTVPQLRRSLRREDAAMLLQTWSHATPTAERSETSIKPTTRVVGQHPKANAWDAFALDA